MPGICPPVSRLLGQPRPADRDRSKAVGAVEVAKAALDEIPSEWKTYLGACNFTLPYQILDQLREITDHPYARQTRPRPAAVPLPAGLCCRRGRHWQTFDSGLT